MIINRIEMTIVIVKAVQLSYRHIHMMNKNIMMYISTIRVVAPQVQLAEQSKYSKRMLIRKIRNYLVWWIPRMSDTREFYQNLTVKLK